MSIKTNLRAPVATKEDWESENPILKLGQMAIQAVYDASGAIVQTSPKIGDGITRWNDLPFMNSAVYQDTTPVNSPVGSWANGDVLLGKSHEEILKGILTKYAAPSLSSLKISGSSYHDVEIGTTLSGSLPLTWGTTNNVNIKENSGEFSQSQQVFTDPGAFNAKTGSVTLSIPVAFKKDVPTTIEIKIRTSDIQNPPVLTAYAAAYIRFISEIRWGTLSTPSITTQSQVDSLQNGLLKTTVDGDYLFGPGYPFVWIPEFHLNSQNYLEGKSFKDVDPSSGSILPFDYLMGRQDEYVPGAPSTLDYDNGMTTYKGAVYRAANSFNTNTRLKIQ